MSTERVAVVAGIRTPFVKAGAHFRELGLRDLGAHVLTELVKRSGVAATAVDEFVFSTVLLDPRTPNWAREILFQAGLPKSIYAQSVSNNCISGLVAITNVAERIALGKITTGIAGGVESMSNPALLFSPRATRKFLTLSRSRSLAERLRVLTRFRAADFWPLPPGVTEPSTGLTMGQHMEITAKEWKIARGDQDRVALQSHQRAAQAAADGRLGADIAPLAGVERDTIVRADTSFDKLAKLPAVFDRSSAGTLTAGNSSALTDGASAVLLMAESAARQQGKEVLAVIRDYEYAAIAPEDGLLMAPAVAVPRLLKRLGLKLQDFDLIEIHEAFAAQVLANIRAWEQGWREASVGRVDLEKVNVLGGSIAVGHPFAATGGRIVTALARELSRRKAKRGLISICAAGAMAGAMVIERP